MEVQVLGKSPSWPDRGGACSGYLVREAGFTLLLDCGSGVFAKLREVQDYLDVDAIVISHLHPDHIFDLVPYGFALSYSPRRHPDVVADRDGLARPALHVPPGARQDLRRMGSCWGAEDLLETAFAMREYEPDAELQLGPIRARFCEVPHYIPCFACELSSAGRRFTFGADCAPSRELEQFATGTDLLMLEATLERPEGEGLRGHLTATEAGELGRRSGTGRLALTHYSDEFDHHRLRADAERGFGAEVTLVEQGTCFTV